MGGDREDTKGVVERLTRHFVKGSICVGLLSKETSKMVGRIANGKVILRGGGKIRMIGLSCMMGLHRCPCGGGKGHDAVASV